MPTNAERSTATVVSRGSQSHHTPHVGLAQIAPCTERSKQRTTAISIAASSLWSHNQRLVKRKVVAQPKAYVRTSIALQAVGTCTYMIRCTLPMCSSGGEMANP